MIMEPTIGMRKWSNPDPHHYHLLPTPLLFSVPFFKKPKPRANVMSVVFAYLECCYTVSRPGVRPEADRLDQPCPRMSSDGNFCVCGQEDSKNNMKIIRAIREGEAVVPNATCGGRLSACPRHIMEREEEI